MIELVHLVKRFGPVVAVDDLSLKVERGELFVLLRPNAAGKTTTLKVLTGLMKPTSGSARIAGLDVQAHPLEVRRRLAYVPDFPFLYDKLTPWEFFRFIGQLFRMDDARIREEALRLIGPFNLEPHVERTIETLSHGTRQRVALVAALLHQPEVFVIDEPMVGLDPHHAKVFKDTLRQRAGAGMTVLMSTHQLSLAEELAQRIGIMHHGKLIAVGTPVELRRRSGVEGPLEETFLALTAEEKQLPGELPWRPPE